MSPDLIPAPIWQALGWAMLHFLWVGAGVALIFWATQRLVLKPSASVLRYAHGLLCLLALALAAVACVWHELPQTPVDSPTPVIAPAIEVEPGLGKVKRPWHRQLF